MNCLIVDDEPIARKILENYCGHFPELKVVGLAANALEARSILEKQKVDVLFLDINMPVLDGMSFLRTLKTRPRVILTTAYKEYALEAFELDVVDYLLKPFSLERFMVALDKARPVGVAPGEEESGEAAVFLRSEGKIYKVAFADIVYAEASGNYTLVITESLSLKSPVTFSYFESLLPGRGFDRIHRSFIINRDKITHIEGNRLFLGTHEVPLGQNYREGFLKSLGLS
ncbi:MAG: response regulator transcription factor [Leadbetterella sp.]|nr:response regulator transcription factor [Leadbetterella sp.]